jgi:stage II sporulation protein P
MRNDKEIFRIIKESYPLEPRKDFVVKTQSELIKAARAISKKRRYKRKLIASFGFILCMVSAAWLLFFDGTTIINRSLASFLNSDPSTAIDEEQPSVYLYHTHNQESFTTEVTSNNRTDETHDDSINITLVGEKLNQLLEEKGINAIHEQKDVSEILQERGWSFQDSYKVSREHLVNVLEEHKTIKMAFDIHRDSMKKSVTTLRVGKEDYARIYFIVSKSSSNFEENLKFANLLNQKIEEKVPGLARGVFVKSKENSENQNSYNQDIINQSVLLNIGGVENTLEEEYRSAEVLAEVIDEILIK